MGTLRSSSLLSASSRQFFVLEALFSESDLQPLQLDSFEENISLQLVEEVLQALNESNNLRSVERLRLV